MHAVGNLLTELTGAETAPRCLIARHEERAAKEINKGSLARVPSHFFVALCSRWLSGSSGRGTGWCLEVSTLRKAARLALLKRLLLSTAGLIWVIPFSSAVCRVDTSEKSRFAKLPEGFGCPEMKGKGCLSPPGWVLFISVQSMKNPSSS